MPVHAIPGHHSRRRRLLLLLLFVLAWWALASGRIEVPDRLNPWAELRLAEPPNFLTTFKQRRAASDPERCLAVLAQSRFRFSPVPDRQTAPGCGFSNAVRVGRTGVAVGPDFTLSCPAALALALWELHVMQPAAEAAFGQPVARIEHLGSYACRNVYGREAGRRSRHATANALDLAGFVLADGRRVSVLRDWPGGGDSAGFLRALHRGGCRWFGGALGPDYNAAHADHFHFDVGGYSICR
jgi:hypothetical protein